MMVIAETVFWASLFLVAYTYFFYPAVLFACYALSQIRRDLEYLNVRRDRRRNGLRSEELPPVTFVIPAYNEERYLEAKLDNLRRLDYPADRLEVLFVSDGSTDRTNEILGSAETPPVRSVLLTDRSGKPTALNEGVARAGHDILIFSDAATLFEPDAVRKLVRHFRDPKVGVVCGALKFQGNEEHARTEGVYWRYETALRIMEARLGATLTASGAIYAIRRECYERLEPDVMVEDFLIPMNARKSGFRVVYDPEAVAQDFAAETVADEFTRRVRLAVGSFKALGQLVRVPFRPYTFLAFVSHKLLRWLLPFPLIGLFVANLALVPSSPLYAAAFAGQVLFYGWAALGYLIRHRPRKPRFALMGYFLLAIHFAYLVGLARCLKGHNDARWQRVH